MRASQRCSGARYEPETVARTWATARSSSHFWRTPAPEKRPDGSDAGRQRPTGLRPEEVPPPDHQSRTIPRHEAQTVLRESERSTSSSSKLEGGSAKTNGAIPQDGAVCVAARTGSGDLPQHDSHRPRLEVDVPEHDPIAHEVLAVRDRDRLGRGVQELEQPHPH